MESPLLSFLHVEVNWQWPQRLSYRVGGPLTTTSNIGCGIQWTCVGFCVVIESRLLRHFPFVEEKEKGQLVIMMSFSYEHMNQLMDVRTLAHVWIVSRNSVADPGGPLWD